jgi:hypothetical protein
MTSKKSTTTSQNQDKTQTIDEKHTEMLNHFNHLETTEIPRLKAEIKSLKTVFKDAKTNPSTTIDTIMELKDQIQAKSIKLANIKSEKKQYLLNNSQYIFNYFEQKKDISQGGGNKNTDVLNTFFKIKKANQDSENINSTKYAKSKNIYQQYWRNVNNELINIHDFVINSDICDSCHKGEMIPHDEEGILICNNRQCSTFVTHIIDSSKPTNKEPPNEVSYTAYIRLNHFKEILSQFQAKETTQIPEAVIDAIRARIKKERITNMALLNYDKMREILKKLGLNRYFEHIQYINSIFGIKPPIMNEELHETLCVLFIEIQKPWATHCPPNRTNFFNYTYTLHQLCVLLDQTQYLPYIPMMKDVEKQREQDAIWRLVTQDLDWCFFPTV